MIVPALYNAFQLLSSDCAVPDLALVVVEVPNTAAVAWSATD